MRATTSTAAVAALMLRAAAALECAFNFPDCQAPRVVEIWNKFTEHNITLAQFAVTTSNRDGWTIDITDAQVDAVIAADEAPLEQDESLTWDYDKEKRHTKHVYKTLNAGFSLSDIHILFHNSDGLPIRLSDAAIDAAIAAHATNAARTVKREVVVDCEMHFPNYDSPRSIEINEKFMAHNLTIYQRLAALMTEEDAISDTDLTDAQVDAIVSAEQAPFDQEVKEEYGVTHDLVNEKRQLVQIYKVLDAKLSSAEIYNLFHSKDGLPIMLSGEKVDAAIAARNALSIAQVPRV